MVKLASSAVRANFSSSMEQAELEPLTIERRGQKNLVLLDEVLYQKLLAAHEELEDIHLFDEAMEEADASVPWGQVLEDLGW